MKNFNRLLVLSLTIVAILLAGPRAKADTLPLKITFDVAYQTGVSGQTLTFDGIISNISGGQVILGSDNFTLAAPGGAVNDFFLFTPLFLDAGTSSDDLALFAFTIAPGTPAGLYTEDYQILDGSGNVVGNAVFDINVTPEPGTILLLGTGLLLLAGLIRSRLPKTKTLTAI